MSREWKPGDVAMVRTQGSEPRQMTRYDTGSERGWYWGNGIAREGQAHFSDGRGALGATVQPLVVLDPNNREQAERLADLIEPCGDIGHCDANPCNSMGCWGDRIQAALRSLVTPPKPDEPQGLGAVVEDEDGVLWVRSRTERHYWRKSVEDGKAPYFAYEAIAAVRILSEGVQP